MEESLEYLLNYKVRVSGIIFKLDPDNKEKRILTVQENSLYGLLKRNFKKRPTNI